MRRWIIAGAILLAGCSPGDVAQDRAAGAETLEQPTATPAQESQRSADVVYVDVRTPQEYAEGHVAGAINIPHDQMAERWHELDRYRDDAIMLYCRSGRRSGIAYDILARQGFDNIENAGGLRDLVAEGVPVAR